MLTLGIIDYGAGNLQSVRNSFLALGQDSKLIQKPEDLEGISHLVLPGVGSFGACSEKLHAQGLVPAMRVWIAADKPFLGICIGYQILFEESEESPGVAGLGILKGKVIHFPLLGEKIPHMGWNTLHIKDARQPIWNNIDDNSYFYFVHSYFPCPADQDIISAECEYGTRFAAAIGKNNLIATQFHPEKSQALGSKLLANFLTLS